jgi:CRP-like cAMP-binding protein
LLLDRPRTAAVTAKTDMTILDIDRRSFNLLLDDIPMIARKMLPVVAERLASNAEHQHDT